MFEYQAKTRPTHVQRVLRSDHGFDTLSPIEHGQSKRTAGRIALASLKSVPSRYAFNPAFTAVA